MYPADALEQVVNLTDTWWPNVGPKETLMIALTTAPDDRTIVGILPKRQSLIFIMFWHYAASRLRAIILQWI